MVHSMSLHWKDRIFFLSFFVFKGFTKLIVLFDHRKSHHYCADFGCDILQTNLLIETVFSISGSFKVLGLSQCVRVKLYWGF
jgi:hypothetical protein